MDSLGGWWMSTCSLADDEGLDAKYPANYFRESGRPLGGRLYVTDRRVIFLPHRIDSLFGGAPAIFRADDTASVESETAADRPTSEKSIPDRLQIERRDGSLHLFVVSDLDDAIARVSERLGHTDA